MGRPKKVKPPLASTNIDTNKLTLTDIIEDNKKYDELVKVEFPNGKYTEVYKQFNKVKIDEMLVDFSNFLNDYSKQIGDFPTGKVIDYISLHIVTTFSTLLDRLPNGLEEKVNVFNHLLKNDLVETVFNSFNQDEVAKVFKHMLDKQQAALSVINQNKEMRSKLKEYVETSDLANKDIIKDTFFEDAEDGK